MKKWRRELRKEQRAMDREISKLEQMERKSRDECRKYGKEGRQDACKIVAREIVRTRAARNRMLMAKAQINSVNMQLQTQAAMVRAAGCMKKSTEVMRRMNKLVKLPELQKTMMEMQREMERSGLIEEVVGDALDELGEVVRDVAVRRAAEVVVVGVLREAAVVERPREVVDAVLLRFDRPRHDLGVDVVVQVVVEPRLDGQRLVQRALQVRLLRRVEEDRARRVVVDAHVVGIRQGNFIVLFL